MITVINTMATLVAEFKSTDFSQVSHLDANSHMLSECGKQGLNLTQTTVVIDNYWGM